MTHPFHTVGIVGTGAMGRGIAQICAQAGSLVLLHDSQEQACQKAIESLQTLWLRMAEKGRLSPAQVQEYMGRLRATSALSDLASCDLVIEAIVEKLDAKQSVFQQLEALVRPDAVLATNLSLIHI